MPNLQKFNAKLCYTVAGVLIHEEKVLLIKHKKAGFWMPPGGHVDENELPHVASEREFWEETGIKVRAVDVYESIESTETEYLPNPFATNLHWISKENYEQRLASDYPEQRVTSEKWKQGCEQHYCFVYFVEPVGHLNFKQNVEETDGIGWFTLEELDDLEMSEDIRAELRLAFKIRKLAK